MSFEVGKMAGSLHVTENRTTAAPIEDWSF